MLYNVEDNRQTTSDIQSQLGHTFEQYNLKPQLLKALSDKRWKAPSPIQEYSIPVILQGHSLIARAKNGTGKTGAFLLPLLQLINTQKSEIQALILVPSKQLTTQVCQIANDIGKYMGLGCVSITGGQSYESDSVRLNKNIHLVIATPGRIMDLGIRKIANLQRCKLLVLDQADRLLQQSFYKTIERIISLLAHRSQILLYSATFPKEIKNFTDRYMSDSKMINLMREHTLVGVSQYFVYLDDREKMKCLNHYLQLLNIDQAFVFANSQKRVEYIYKKVLSKGIECLQINGNMDKTQRMQVYQNFTKGKCKILVATDVWARGIDIRSVNVVINFDFPQKSEVYLHRIGRSGRYGHKGLAINFIVQRDKQVLIRIEKELGIQIEPMPSQPPDESLYCYR